MHLDTGMNTELFPLSDLFQISMGTDIDLNKCILVDLNEDGINYVARSENNNGITARVQRIPGIEPQKSGLLTVAVSGSVLSTFLQPEEFYSGHDLFVLEPLMEMGRKTKLYLATLIKANKYRYNYGRAANKTLKDIEIKLPITSAGNPDFEWMENFIAKQFNKITASFQSYENSYL